MGSKYSKGEKFREKVLCTFFESRFCDYLFASNTYNACGQLIKTVAPDGEIQLYTYENDGTVIEGRDLNGDSRLDISSERMIKSSVVFDPTWPENKGSWKSKQEAAYQGHWITQNTTWQTEDETQNRQQSLGVEGYRTQEYPPIAQRGQNYQTQEVEASGLKKEIAYTVDKGVILASRTTIKDAQDTVVTTTSSTHNIWGQTLTQTDARTGITSYTYDEATGTLLSQTTPDNLRTTNSYDSLGRLEKMTLPDGSTQHRSYDSENNVVRQWGSQQYPVSYEYDAYGRKTSMTTYRSPVGDVATWPDSSAEGDKTTWSYDPTTGNLLKKTYADGRELSYTYTPGGKIKTQTNARGNVTTCTYNSAGQQVNLQVNDNGITPTKTVAYDQLGRKTQVTTEGISTYQYVYNDQNQLIEERITIPPVTGDENINLERSIVRFYDAYGRPMGYQLKHGNTLEQAITYS